MGVSMNDVFKEIIRKDNFTSRSSNIAFSKRLIFCIHNICVNGMSLSEVLNILQLTQDQYKEYYNLSREKLSFYTYYNAYMDANALISTVDALSTTLGISIKAASEMTGSSLESYKNKCRFLDEIDHHKDEIMFPDDEVDAFFEEWKVDNNVYR